MPPKEYKRAVDYNTGCSNIFLMTAKEIKKYAKDKYPHFPVTRMTKPQLLCALKDEGDDLFKPASPEKKAQYEQMRKDKSSARKSASADRKATEKRRKEQDRIREVESMRDQLKQIESERKKVRQPKSNMMDEFKTSQVEKMLKQLKELDREVGNNRR